MNMFTLDELTTRHGVTVDDHHDLTGLVPVTAGLSRQGDVIVIPAAMARQTVVEASTTPLPAAGYPVVKGESGGNTHLLLADGPVFFSPAAFTDATSLDLGVLTVPEGSTAFLAHPEHAFQGMAPGTYVVRRQREQADELRMVAD